MECNSIKFDKSLGKTFVLCKKEGKKDVEFSCDKVVVTVSVGVLKADCIDFSPPLPKEKVEAIDKIGFGVLNKIAMEFDELFWNSKVNNGINYMSKTRGEFPHFLSLYPVCEKPILVGFVGGKFAQELEQ